MIWKDSALAASSLVLHFFSNAVIGFKETLQCSGKTKFEFEILS
jgi:hypothetical protein